MSRADFANDHDTRLRPRQRDDEEAGGDDEAQPKAGRRRT